MLREIQIKNFVLMENVSLTFDEGLNVLTGETGAGKSIVIDALGLVLGDRFKSDAVRQGAERSEVAAVFDVPRTPAFAAWWDARGFGSADEIVIRREGAPDGRSRAYLNDRPVTSTALEEIGEFLVDIHGQHEHQHILKPALQVSLLDRFGDLEKRCDEIRPLFQAWRALADELQTAELSEQERLQRMDLYRYQLQEIDQAKLRANESQELAERLPELKNAERLRSLAESAYGALYREEGSAVERLGHAQKMLLSLAALAPSIASLPQEIEEVRQRLEEAARSLQTAAERWQADPQALDALLARQDLISRLQKKYGGTVAAVLERAEQLRADLDRLENADAYRQELKKRCQQARDVLEKASLDLSVRRKSAARQLTQAVQKQLGDLGLEQAVFRCQVYPLPVGEGNLVLSKTGMDHVVFEWAPNPGEGIQPLKAIVSGGEMSRVMLALKTVLAQADRIPTLIFDEVDAGIGGLTGQAVGKKLRALSHHHQILCVSHLPQIAACAHAHFQVSKEVAQARTRARVIRLESTERVHEMARLLGSQVTPTSVKHAKELLAQNQ